MDQSRKAEVHKNVSKLIHNALFHQFLICELKITLWYHGSSQPWCEIWGTGIGEYEQISRFCSYLICFYLLILFLLYLFVL